VRTTARIGPGGARRARPSGAGVVAPRALRSALALALCLGPACSSTGSVGLGETVVLERAGPARPAVDAAFVLAFDALQAAVDDGEDDVARRILASIRARGPSADLLEFARGYERILDGRALLRDLDLALAVDPVEGAPADRRLVLVASHPRAEDVVLRLPAGMLARRRTAIDPAGNESRSLTTERSPLLDELAIPAGREVRLPVCSFVIDVGGALAVRERWTLVPRAGTVVVGGEELPAQDPVVAACETVRVARFLPGAAVAPEELVSYLARDEIFLPALLERAVRIAPERRDEALSLLEPAVARLAAERPERVAEAAPAFRWLAGGAAVDPGRDVAAWAAWFRARADARRRERDTGALVLPDGARAR
jgi:hypothetical protein